jgi:N-carbamoylputrescine amidase
MIRIAGVQMHSSADLTKNLVKAKELLGIAAARGAKIVCFHELFNTPWFPYDVDEAHFKFAEDEKGPTLSAMKAAAKEHKVTLICPIFEKVGDDNYFNTAFVISSAGKIIGKYQKVHIPQIPHWEEKFYFNTGETGFPVFKAHGVTFGILICWDNFFPEAARIMALKGAQILFCPTAAAFASHNKWETAIRANSMVNGVYSLRVNRIGKENDILKFYGKSFCAGPDGNLFDEPAGSQDGVVMVAVDVKEIKQVRKTWSFFKERKKELYSEVIEIDE